MGLIERFDISLLNIQGMYPLRPRRSGGFRLSTISTCDDATSRHEVTTSALPMTKCMILSYDE
jgi:hypothetical protein